MKYFLSFVQENNNIKLTRKSKIRHFNIKTSIILYKIYKKQNKTKIKAIKLRKIDIILNINKYVNKIRNRKNKFIEMKII